MNIKKNKLTAFAVSALMAASLMTLPVSAASAHLSETSVTLSTGETAPISLIGSSGSTKWQISDSSVFRYSNGTITAKGEGSAYLYAINNGKKYKCLITVSDTKQSSSSDGTQKKNDNIIKIRKSDSVKLTLAACDGGVKVSTSNSKVCSLSTSGIDENNRFVLTIKGRKSGSAVISVISRKDNRVLRKIAVSVGNYSKSDSPDSITLVTEQSEKNVDTSSFCDEVISLVNAERNNAGLEPLKKSELLTDAAQIRVKELKTKFSHTRPDGSSCFTVIDTAETKGENIAKGQNTPTEVMKSWMSSPGHKENILEDEYKYIGVGYDSSTGCWVQLFLG